jgi:hypothetical protein
MAAPRHLPKPDRRRALELLAASRRGCTEATMRAHGFTIGQIVALARTGLANARAEGIATGGAMEIVLVVRITAEGRRALAEHRARSPRRAEAHGRRNPARRGAKAGFQNPRYGGMGGVRV